jgi:hypothetical protein
MVLKWGHFNISFEFLIDPRNNNSLTKISKRLRYSFLVERLSSNNECFFHEWILAELRQSLLERLEN